MFPINLQHDKTGLGMNYEDFAATFQQVCKQHIHEGRAKGFAFVFYNTNDEKIRYALKDEGGFRALNEESGNDMTIFYVRDDFASEIASKFNNKFREILQIQDQVEPPCIVFFRVYEEEIYDVSFGIIDDSTDQIHLIVEHLRQLISDTIVNWRKQGDFSALNPIPLLKFILLMAKFN